MSDLTKQVTQAWLKLEGLVEEMTQVVEDQERELHFRRNDFPIEEASEMVGLDAETIEGLIHSGQLAYRFIGGEMHASGADLWDLKVSLDGAFGDGNA